MNWFTYAHVFRYSVQITKFQLLVCTINNGSTCAQWKSDIIYNGGNVEHQPNFTVQMKIAQVFVTHTKIIWLCTEGLMWQDTNLNCDHGRNKLLVMLSDGRTNLSLQVQTVNVCLCSYPRKFKSISSINKLELQLSLTMWETLLT